MLAGCHWEEPHVFIHRGKVYLTLSLGTSTIRRKLGITGYHRLIWVAFHMCMCWRLVIGICASTISIFTQIDNWKVSYIINRPRLPLARICERVRACTAPDIPRNRSHITETISKPLVSCKCYPHTQSIIIGIDLKESWIRSECSLKWCRSTASSLGYPLYSVDM